MGEEKPKKKPHRATGNPRGQAPKYPPQTEEQMIAVGQKKKLQNNAYSHNESEKSANEEAIGRIVQFAFEGVQNVIENGGRIRLSDSEAVKAITYRYMDVCSRHGMLPTMTGLSMAIGCTLHSLEDHKRKHPDSETTAWLKYMKDVFAEILAQSMLAGKTVAIPSIFTLKAMYHWRDDPGLNLDDQERSDKVDAKTIMEKYSDLPD